MAKYESKIVEVNALQQRVYDRWADLSQFQALKDNMPAEVKEQIKARLAQEAGGKLQISNVQFTTDTVSFVISGMTITMRIVEREEPKLVKYKAEGVPVEAVMWIQMLPKEAYTTKVRVTLDVDIPLFLRPMVGKKLDGAADQVAEMIARLPY